jgi:SAM-dependent methyltransferase
MHAEVSLWLQQCREVDYTGALVYEVGALNVNGQARDIVPSGWVSWIGFDLVAGPGVDFPGDAEELLPDFEQCDVMVSTEVLEHAPRWAELLGAMCDAVKPGGWLVLTCAGIGRKPHAADGSPGGPHPGEYYANVSLAVVEAVCRDHGFMTVAAEEGWPGDTRYLGRKGEE